MWVHADPTRLAQVVGCLLQNATRFTPRNGNTEVRVEADGTTHQVLLHVRDTGVGIGQDLLERLFEPFCQADQTLDRSRGGLGLGLALVKGLVDLHGGTITAHSDGVGKGTEFVVRLPRGSDPGSTCPALHASVSHHVSRRVLVVEDQADAADSLHDALVMAGHTVEVARDGPTGLAMAKAMKPDVMLCDVGLPGMDGYQVARAVRAEPALQAVKLVALTGYALPEDKQRAREAGFDHHLAKPPVLEQLTCLVDDLPNLTWNP